MKKKFLISIGFFILGCVLGSSALQTAQSASPPINWKDIPFIFLGSAFGMVFVLGIQILWREPKLLKWGLHIFMQIALFISGAGAAAAIIAGFTNDISPASLLFISIGAGLLIGLGVSSMLIRWRFKQVP